MRILLVEDDLTTRLLMNHHLKPYGSPDIVVTGKEAVEAVRVALQAQRPYDLIVLDIMTPEMDGHQALREIRALEDAHEAKTAVRAKVIVTSALSDPENVMEAIREDCDYYLAKPIHKSKLVNVLTTLGLIE